MAVYHLTNTVQRHGLVLDILKLLAPNTEDWDACTLFDRGGSYLMR